MPHTERIAQSRLTFRAAERHDRGVARTAERDALILDALRRAGRLSVVELAQRLAVGEATVRRSLQRLARQGSLIRTYGGAALPGTRSGARAAADAPDAWKRAIGAAAAELVDDGETIALSSGSTVLELARGLRHRHLTVITTSLDVAAALADAQHIDLVVTGGVVLPGIRSLRGHLTELALRDLRADRVFMGATAIDLEHGYMTEHVQEIAVDRALRAMAREAVILADASKFERVAPGLMFGFDQAATLVTDERVRPEVIDALTALGVRVVVGIVHGAEAAPSGAR